LKMGWRLVQRLPVAATPRSPRTLVRLARARTPADKWSTPTTAGVPLPEVLAEAGALTELIEAARPRDGRLHTDRSAAYLAWRYGSPPLHYRALVAPGGIEAGLAVFRLRRRGAALEAAICELLVPPDDRRTGPALVRQVLRATGADHAVQIGRARPAPGTLPVPGQGPTPVWRDLTETPMPPAESWALALGDIELF